ncbi:MAG: adenylyltransferase/cytidyltransferase family protein [Candidatus Levybacteria bacterium]|nr:adenylyltransferase/cytidyltransferase family protein [Candidatus Levybacteria bacterium]
MGKVVTLEKAIDLANEIKQTGRTIVLAGGCFDILHIGHIKFLEKAKKQGDFLFILLENDDSVKKLKGENRPINSQSDRAQILSALQSVNFVVLLNKMESDSQYDDLIQKLKPDIIAVTQNDSQEVHAKRQAKNINAKVVKVTDKIEDQSTTRLAKLISENF